jgi:hypothetical protein
MVKLELQSTHRFNDFTSNEEDTASILTTLQHSFYTMIPPEFSPRCSPFADSTILPIPG